MFDSYVQAIRNSVNSRLFRNLYINYSGKKEDVLENGRFSCAVFVSSVLYLYKLISDVHATVAGSVTDLEKSGWEQIPKPEIGSVIVWENHQSNEGHKHIGFYIGEDKAISNSSKKKQPILHHWTFGTKKGQPVRKIEKILWKKIK